MAVRSDVQRIPCCGGTRQIIPFSMADSSEPVMDPAATYRARAAEFTRRRDELASRSRKLSHGRIAAFIAGVLLGLSVERSPTVLLAMATAVAVAAFIALVVLHRRTRRREQWFADMAQLNEHGLDRLA